MKRNRLLWLLPLLLCCCTQEELSDCPHPIDISVKVVNVEGDDITGQGAVESLSLYLFDNRQKFLSAIDARMGEPLNIYLPNQDTLHVVLWGNLNSDRQQSPRPVVGTPMSEAIVRLNERQSGTSQPDGVVADSPDDLFYCCEVVSLKSDNQTSYRLQMSRAVGSMFITLRHLKSYANRYDDDYSLRVRETYNGIDFYGRLTGNKVGYLPAASFNANQELVASLFNLMPSHAEGNIEIDVYHKNTLITTVKNDSGGSPLRAVRGRVLNVLVDFRMQVSVEVSITPWGVTEIWKEF